ncbi:MAG: electron transport complex subunit RsxA [bacterium]|nr:electron transport complex subunit RsxA [bacterium]
MSQDWLAITVGTILVNNFVLSRFLGICPFLGVSRKLEPAIGMSGAVIFVMTAASFISSIIFNFILNKEISFTIGGHLFSGHLVFLQTLVFIAVVASLVQVVEISLQKLSPPLYKSLGIYLPLITTNCAVMGVVLLNATKVRDILGSTVFGFCSAIGFSIAMILFASLREKIDLAKLPKPMEGTAIALVTAGILAMGFMGFSALVKM